MNLVLFLATMLLIPGGLLLIGASAGDALLPRGPDAPHVWVEDDGVMRDGADGSRTCVLPRGMELSVQADDTPVITRLWRRITYSVPPAKVTVIDVGGPSSASTCPVGRTGLVESRQVEAWSITTGLRSGKGGARPAPASKAAGSLG